MTIRVSRMNVGKLGKGGNYAGISAPSRARTQAGTEPVAHDNATRLRKFCQSEIRQSRVDRAG